MLTPQNARRLDALAVERYALPTICLMENAARCLAQEVLAASPPAGGAPGVLVVCGPGNNGGDGFAAARHLHNAGLRVAIVATGEVDQYQGDAAVNAQVARQMGLAIEIGGKAAYERAFESIGKPANRVTIDALFGTGLTRAPDGVAGELIAAVNARSGHSLVVAADIPSGLDALSGRAMGPCVRADVTVTFAGLKPGLVVPSARVFTGRVVVADIGVPRELLEELSTPYTARSS